MAVGVGTRILSWDASNVSTMLTIDEPRRLPLFAQSEPESVFKLIEGYDRREVDLTEVLNAIVDYEKEKRFQRY